MKLAVYTSFAVNYLAKARVLADTIKQANPDVDVIAIVCDRFPPGFDIREEPFDQVWMLEDYAPAQTQSWLFRHNIMELSTAVKGWGLQRLLASGYDYVMYLDPDCWVLEDPAILTAELSEHCSVAVVPHTARPADSDEEIRIIEMSSLRHGIYNLGFLLVRADANGRSFADWWGHRLERFCIDDFKKGLFTDQRWFDLALGYFKFIQVLDHKGVDVASWNIGQRILARSGDRYRIDGYPLVCYHFSGVGPAGIHRWVRDKFAPSDPLAAELEFRYERMIELRGQAQLGGVVPYFDLYSDGTRIPVKHRIQYREDISLQERFPEPYNVGSLQNLRETVSAPGEPARKAVIRHDLENEDDLARQLFDAEYFTQAADPTSADRDAAWQEYCRLGWTARIAPNRVFDLAYYRMFVPDKEISSYLTPLHHYVAKGMDAGISPSWIYDDQFYLASDPDIIEGIRSGHFVCGFDHFVKHGIDEGRSACSYFNDARYRHKHLDVASAVQDGMYPTGERHYLLFGHREGREFD